MEFAIKTRLEYDDYCAIPADGKRYELIDGEVHVTPAPSPERSDESRRAKGSNTMTSGGR